MNTPQFKIGDKVWTINPYTKKAKEYTVLGIIQAEDMHLREVRVDGTYNQLINIYYQVYMIDNNRFELNEINKNMFIDEYSVYKSKEELLDSL